ncbi:MAG: CRISPR-associated endonuclease Cas3'', partial [Singulisphaera sp.]
MAKPTRSLVEHTDDVVRAFRALFGTPEAPTHLTGRWLAFFRLTEADQRPFLRNTLMACLVHDWGKANTGFANMLARTGAQTVRHEFVSALIMTQPQVWSWLESAQDVDLSLVLGAVAGHHLKAAEPQKKLRSDPGQFGATQKDSHDADFSLTWHHPRIREQLDTLVEEFAIDKTKPEGVPLRWSIELPPGQKRANVRDEGKKACKLIHRLRDDIEDEPASPRARMLRAVRSALIAADSAGSGLFRTHEEAERTDDVHRHIESWIAESFDPEASLDEAKV